MNGLKLLEATANDFASEYSRLARENKDFAMYLFGRGVRGEITGETLKQLDKDMFDAQGVLTPKAKEVLSTKKIPNLKNITLERFTDILGRKITGIAMRRYLGLE